MASLVLLFTELLEPERVTLTPEDSFHHGSSSAASTSFPVTRDSTWKRLVLSCLEDRGNNDGVAKEEEDLPKLKVAVDFIWS